MTQIGMSSLDVYPLCLGTNPFGWTADREDSHAVLGEYADAGGNFLDTADVYSAWREGNEGGESERIIGSWLRGRKRDELVIATKVAKLPGHRGLSSKNVHECADASLRRLDTDYIDLYYAHEYDPRVPISQSVAAFADLQQQGKIREVGLSNFDAQQIIDWVAACDEQGVPRPVAIQPHYNLVWRTPFENDLSILAEEYDLGVMPYWSLAAGLLTGKYKSAEQIMGARAGSVRKHATDQAFKVIEAQNQIASELNVEPTSVAIAWLLTRPVVTAPIASARSAEQVPPLLEGVTITLSDEEIRLLDDLSAGLGSEGAEQAS